MHERGCSKRYFFFSSFLHSNLLIRSVPNGNNAERTTGLSGSPPETYVPFFFPISEWSAAPPPGYSHRSTYVPPPATPICTRDYTVFKSHVLGRWHREEKARAICREKR
ncbi:hypothetical protein CDAR_33431 [Caerostris darwini]|uniref:Uncharacterized protein n=1 Tax=Caerostris darwini TaxID=1538125 RepID=A0AAV4VCY9_9ARAC|nr:hypothetical protein CDAR_33431 [Caerostris darwini]